MDKKINCELENKEGCATVGTIIIILAVMLGVPFVFILWVCYHARKEKLDQENLEMIERQDQVIKTYQIAKMIVSGTAFESLQLTVLQTRLHFALDISVNIS